MKADTITTSYLGHYRVFSIAKSGDLLDCFVFVPMNGEYSMKHYGSDEDLYQSIASEIPSWLSQVQSR
jgi:hypothetical protein